MRTGAFLLCLIVTGTTFSLRAFGAEDLRMDFERDALLLNGRWECLMEHGDEEVFKPEVAAKLGRWRKARVPGRFTFGVKREDHRKIKFVWIRRDFRLSEAQAARDGVLKWNHIRHGATVWINGRRIGEHPTVGPHTILIPPDVLHAGQNQILLKIPGWSGIPKGKAGYPLIPTGSGTQSWGIKVPGVLDDIWIEFYDRAYLKWILAVPDVEAGKVTFRIWIDSARRLPKTLAISAAVRPVKGKSVAGQAKAKVSTTAMPVEITVPVKDAKRWTPQEPHLYLAELQAEAGGELCDRVRFRFGMRQIRVADGHFRLNGEPLWFRGSNLVCEWLWGGRDNVFNQQTKRYIVDEARAMNLNSFRTHTLPPPTAWLDVCDEYGTMILAELPVLYNNRDFKYTPEELEIFHKNALLDATGWVTKLWNHPSLVIWVLSNESPRDHDWESGPYWQYVHDLDPTRPAMRAGGYPRKTNDTPDVADMHTCGNYTWGGEGRVIRDILQAATKKDPRRPLTNTEYMNRFGKPGEQTQHWLGRPDHPDADLCFAEFAMEHTEAMRRAGLDGIFPYMYARWPRFRGNNWRDDYPTPMAAALHSAMSPVLASIDLFDRNFLAGTEVSSRLVLINEMHEDVPAKIDIYVTPKDPQFVPDEGALAAAISHQSFDHVFKADSTAEKTIRWQVPRRQGVYYLAVVVRRSGDRPVVSQRVVRAFANEMPAERLKAKRAVVLGASRNAEAWLKGRGVGYTTSLRDGVIRADVLLIWDAGKISESQRSAATPILLDFVKRGGKLVILSQARWTWKELVDFKPAREFSSRAFLYPGVEHPMLAGIGPEFLKRWNGLPGRIADHAIEGDLLKRGKKLLWIENPQHAIAVSLPVGRGEILVCFLKIKPRISRTSKTYDPVAERILCNLIAW